MENVAGSRSCTVTTDECTVTWLQLAPAKASRRREDEAGIATVVPFAHGGAARVRLIRSPTRGKVVGHRHYGRGM